MDKFMPRPRSQEMEEEPVVVAQLIGQESRSRTMK